MTAINLISGQPWERVVYGTTTRNIKGYSQAPFDQFNVGLHCGDNAEAVYKNRALLRTILPSEPIWLNQVHGNKVFDADTMVTEPPQVDAAVTTQKDTVLAIMTADCLPVVIADLQGEVIGAAHAGWRGLQAGVLENTVQMMLTKKPNITLRAWIGPAISQSVFEVGQEVFDAFTKNNADLAVYFKALPNADKYLADLTGIAAYKLQKKGVQQIEQSGECTYLNAERYFSYRRENPTGRMVTLVWRV
ncbi:peptidoglycan editing factor PgeF [Pelistega ratti]|uniref:peptidoglycan editing factor PgeF n=1 Tax=Pelistega ratti TaxID=2652177 RepID=UPI001359DCCC|nr:peptidoglycan editing factor PgeF [Pelistega ratti]